MKLILVVSSLIFANAGVIKETDNDECGGIKLHEEVLKEDIDRPYLLTVDRSTDTLYFSYNVEENSDIFTTASLDLKTKEFKTIDDVPNGFAQAVDPATHDVYVGGSDGLYKYDHNTHISESIGERGNDIWNVFFKEVLYFSVFPSQYLFTLTNGEVSRFPDLQDTKVDHFVIDANDVVYFTNGTGLYGQKKGTNTAKVYKEKSRTENGARGLTIDVNGKVYVCFQNGLYVVNTETSSLDRVVELDDAFGLAFDSNNNMIYADATRLVRLTQKKNAC